MPDGDPEFQPVQVVLQNAREIAIQIAIFRLEFGQVIEHEGFVVARVLRFSFHFGLFRVDTSHVGGTGRVAVVIPAVVVDAQ